MLSKGEEKAEEMLSRNPAAASPKVLPASKSARKITADSLNDEDQRGKSILQLIQMLSIRAATAMTSRNPYSDDEDQRGKAILQLIQILSIRAATAITSSNPIPYEDPAKDGTLTLFNNNNW
jgi:hypothetical protein